MFGNWLNEVDRQSKAFIRIGVYVYVGLFGGKK
jgi:hypothetical protein